MKKKFLIGVLLFFVVLLPVYGFAQFYSTSDLEGDWIGYDFSVMPLMSAVQWLRGNATIDASGTFTSATYTDPLGNTLAATSGSAALDSNGVLSGSISLPTGATVTVNHGKLDSGKTHAAYVTTASDGSMMNLGVFFKSGGTFSSQDLEGTWHSYITVIDALTDAVFWAYGTFTMDNQGNITASSFTAADFTPATITSGALTLDSAGIIGGGFALSIPGQTVTIQHGKLDQSKTIGAFVSLEQTGTMAYAWIVKAGGTFADEDLEDIWYSYSIDVYPPPYPSVFWLRGKFSINDSGNLVGSYINSDGHRRRAPSGSMSLDSSGVITGTIGTLDYGTVTIRNGKLDQGKTSGCGVSVSSNGRLSMTIVFKVDTIQPSFAGAATNAVLANMYQDTAVAYAGLAIAGASENYPWMQLYAQAAYEYAEDAYLQAFAALDQSSTFWGTYAVQYANYDLTNRYQALGAIKAAAKNATEGDLQTAAYLTGLGIASGAAADLYNGTTIWCSSMEHGISQ